MKKIVILIVLIGVFTQLFGNENFQYERINDIVIVNYENENPVPGLDKKEIEKIIAVPCDEVEIVVNSCEVSLYSKDGDFLENTIVNGDNHVEIIKGFVMRELKAHQVKIKLIDENEENISVLKCLNFALAPQSPIVIPDKLSQAFLPIYRFLVDNFDSSYLANLEIIPSKMLIIGPNNTVVDILSPFIDWKEAKGISTVVATLDEIGYTSTEIKIYIQDAYDNWEEPPDYLLLLGDVNGCLYIPSFYISSDNDVTDHPYTLLEGDDYFPEMLVGRISFDSYYELSTALNKILAYEKNPYIDDPDWFTRALLVAGNYSPTPPIPITPTQVSIWLREKMLNYGYTQVDTVFYPPTYPGTSEITNAIINGVGFVNYRGWGDSNGWHYPYFHRENIPIENGMLLPIVTSFVCNTGDFANSVDPCFGEKWLIAGYPSSFGGGVAFVGPSDLHTSTKYNNSIFSGFYYGVLDEDIFSLGSAVLRGKIEIFNNFPLSQELGEDVEFYFHVYNILGDPSLSMWTRIPEEIICNIPDEVSLGTNNIEINCSNLSEGIVTARKGEEFYNVEVIDNGYAVLYINPETEGEIEVTITSPNYLPYFDTINVVSESTDIGLYDYQIDGEIISGGNVTISISLKNYGSQTAEGVSADLNTDNPYVNMLSGTANFGNF
ncbi:MAG: hypothetical protein ISS28_03355, partial [Candidatus Cloacimonetes bacterium]|nr:hypothetical protein [Candidatus Cloacimonadota bacterium]